MVLDCCSSPPPESTRSAKAASRHGRLGATCAAIAIALLPKCPACWSVYAGLSSVLGLSIALEPRYLVPLTAGSMALAVGGLWLRARRGGGYGPSVLGALMAASVLIGKFLLENQPWTYVSLLGLVVAALWSSRRNVSARPWLRPRFRTAP